MSRRYHYPDECPAAEMRRTVGSLRRGQHVEIWNGNDPYYPLDCYTIPTPTTTGHWLLAVDEVRPLTPEARRQIAQAKARP